MNWDIVEGKWKQLKSEVKGRWSKLTDDDLGNIAAKRDRLVGKIQERYGVRKDQAEQEIDSWMAEMDEGKEHMKH